MDWKQQNSEQFLFIKLAVNQHFDISDIIGSHKVVDISSFKKSISSAKTMKLSTDVYVPNWQTYYVHDYGLYGGQKINESQI